MFEHYESCTRETIGRVVLSFIAQGVDAANLHGIKQAAEAFQSHPGHCTCAATQLRKVQDELTRERKLQRLYGTMPGRTVKGDQELIARLTATRNELRELVNYR